MKIYTILFVLINSTLATAQFVDVTVDQNFALAKTSLRFGSGVSAADYDNDGDIDLFVCTAEGYPDNLYQNNEGNFEPIGETVGLSSMKSSRMALWIDIDGDTDLDLVVGGNGFEEEITTQLYRQENGIFTEVTDEAGIDQFGANIDNQNFGGLAAADINNDGFVDIVLTIWRGPIKVFINDGNGVFEDQSNNLGLDTRDYAFWQPFLHDFNSDGYIDIYCNVDFNDNQFWLNSAEGLFDDVSKKTNSNSSFNEMGITLGDIDNDGDFDIYSTNIFNNFGEDTYNILLQQNQNEDSDIFFTEIAKDLGIGEGGWGWGATFFDANNDGLIDLAATNGFESDSLDQSKIWIQQPDKTFSDHSDILGFNDNLNGSTLISLDYDRDGDLDMIQGLKGFENEALPFRLLENQTQGVGHYLVVKPRMNGSNHYSIGSVVRAYVNGNVLARIIHAGTSFYGQEPAEAFLGLGSAVQVDSLSITWPGGEISWWYDIGAEQIITLDDSQVVHRPGGFKLEQQEMEIFLSWYDVSPNESGFILQRSNTVDFDAYSEIELPANTTSYIDSDYSMSETYFYRLKAYNSQYSSRFTAVLQTATDDIVLSTDDESPNDIIIYPNPTSSILNIRLDEKIASVKLFTMQGAEVKDYSIELRSGNSGQIELRNIHSGVYFLKINSIVRRIIVK